MAYHISLGNPLIARDDFVCRLSVAYKAHATSLFFLLFSSFCLHSNHCSRLSAWAGILEYLVHALKLSSTFLFWDLRHPYFHSPQLIVAFQPDLLGVLMLPRLYLSLSLSHNTCCQSQPQYSYLLSWSSWQRAVCSGQSVVISFSSLWWPSSLTNILWC